MSASMKKPASRPVEEEIDICMAEISIEAKKFVPAGRIEQLARQWMPPGPPDARRLTLAMGLAADLALAMTSITGVGPFDRMARAAPQSTAVRQQALTALRSAKYYFLHMDRRDWSDLLDVATGKRLRIEGRGLPEARPGVSLIVRVAKLQDERLLIAGIPVPLDEEALRIAAGFMRPFGGGLSSPTRCAEAVFRYLARNGTLSEPELPEEESAAEPIDALATAWARLDGEPSLAEQEKARALTHPQTLIEALTRADIAERRGRLPLAKAYALIAGFMLGVFALRESHGSASAGIDRLRRDLDASIAAGRAPASARALFDRLRLHIQAKPAAGAKADVDLDKLIQRIRALRAKTVEQGCTEQEALSAAEKVAQLLDRHGLSVSELDMRRQACEGAGVSTDRKRRAPIDDCVPGIASFFDCRVWAEMTPAGMLHYVFFGLPADVQAALYLYDLVVVAFATETTAFQASAVYRDAATGARRGTTNSFQLGLARGIHAKLAALRVARETGLRQSSGRDLMLIKASIVDEEMAKLGMQFRSRSVAQRSVRLDAFEAGKEAGSKFEYRLGIGPAKGANG